jgi:AbrB family looped-hinge helix DNA binding protein
MRKQAKVTSKGQVTIPVEVRRALGVQSGDKILFEHDESGIRVRAVRGKSTFAKYRGIGNPGIGPGREGVMRWMREIRGE